MNIAIILAGGVGSRLGAGFPKQFIKLGNKTVIEYSIDVFNNCSKIEHIIIVIHKDYKQKLQDILSSRYTKIQTVEGGETRQESVFNALSFIEKNYKYTDADYVFIHDGARPLITKLDIQNILNNISPKTPISLALPSTDTIVYTNTEHFVTSVPKREQVWNIQTPQTFSIPLIIHAHRLAKQDLLNFSDDTGIVAHYKLAKVKLLKSSTANIKLTKKEDLSTIQNILKNIYR